MELTININVSERFCDAIELLATALSKNNDSEDKVATSEDNTAVINLEEVKVESITITADMLRDKMQAILQKDPDRALDVKDSLLNLGAERISELDQVKYAEFYSELTAIEKEVAA